MRIERIVITGDVFRTASGDPNQLSNVRWLHEELARVLHELTGLPPKVMYRRNEAEGGLAVIAEWYGLLGLAPSVEAWAATFGETSPPQALLDAMRPDYERALVIGFELSPLMRSALDGIGAPWISVGVSPIRFLDDLALSFHFSWPAELAQPGLVSQEHVEEAVARMRARYSNDRSARDLDGACVFLAQTRQDRTLIKDAGFFRDGEAIQRVGRALDGRALVLKPHPLAPANPILPALRQRFGARTTEANIYAILATATDVRFLTISSSAAIEARHFHHTAEMFHPAAHADAGQITSLWAHRSTSFWRSALEPILPLKAAAGFEARTTPDRLRRIHGAWGMTVPRTTEGGGCQANCSHQPVQSPRSDLGDSGKPAKPTTYEAWFAATFGQEVPVPTTRICVSWPDNSEWGHRAHCAMLIVEIDYVKTLLVDIKSRDIPGALGEFGVFQGWWVDHLWQFTEEIGLARDIYGFDSFAGLSKPHPEFDSPFWEEGQYACDLATVAANVKAAERSRIKLIPGFFADSLTRQEAQSVGSYCFARIDCDIYEPALQCLRYLGPRLSDGAILVFDDWPHKLNEGEQEAFHEWLPEVPYLRFEFLFYGTIGHFYMRVHQRTPRVGWVERQR